MSKHKRYLTGCLTEREKKMIDELPSAGLDIPEKERLFFVDIAKAVKCYPQIVKEIQDYLKQKR